jgi:hypothetical protein
MTTADDVTSAPFALRRLREILAGIPPGPVPAAEVRLIETLLSECWPDPGPEAGALLNAWKIPGRTEKLVWDPPILTFRIERHYGWQVGFEHSQVQQWSLDLSDGSPGGGSDPIAYREVETGKMWKWPDFGPWEEDD